jgi:hypothetical protein
MWYFAAREITKDGKPVGLYHFTSMHDGLVTAEGYCAMGCDGHTTAEEACEHYRQYMLKEGKWHKLNYENIIFHCKICGAWTNCSMSLGWAMSNFDLCPLHQDMSYIEQLLSPIHEFWLS